MLWILRPGAPWRDLPERDGPWPTMASRVDCWQRAGVWQKLFDTLTSQADAAGRLDWPRHCVDRTSIRAHQPAAGATKGAQTQTPSVAARAAAAPKSSCGPRATASPSRGFCPLVTREEAPVLVPLLAPGAVTRPGRGQPTRRPRRRVGDQGYSSRTNRQALRPPGIRCTIPRPCSAHRLGPVARTIYRLRNQVERLIKRRKQVRRIATRNEQRDENDQPMLLIAAVVLWLEFANTPYSKAGSIRGANDRRRRPRIGKDYRSQKRMSI